jgi:hypothetical protein
MLIRGKKIIARLAVIGKTIGRNSGLHKFTV